MKKVFLVSIAAKAIGALLEIGLQIFITHSMGVALFGTYSVWINSADLIFWLLFSGIIKCNTFYLSHNHLRLKTFKKKYYLFYVLPILLTGLFLLAFLASDPILLVILMITLLELLVLDASSLLLAKGDYTISLSGEYIFGRLILLLLASGLWISGYLRVETLVLAYALQFLLVGVVFFLVLRKKSQNQKEEQDVERVDLKKWGRFQKADIEQSLISQMPVILQFLVAGAFSSGVISIVLLVKKLINFVTGPTAKVFLPEFSRLYREQNMEAIRGVFSGILHMQMLFLGPVSVALCGFSKVILGLLASDLLDFHGLFIASALVFILGASLGPCGGLLQMTDREKWDNRCREISILVMAGVMILFRSQMMFALYGLCVQSLLESVSKYFAVAYSFGFFPMSLKEYLKLWTLPLLFTAGVYLAGIGDSLVGLIGITGLLFGLQAYLEWRKEKKPVFSWTWLRGDRA